MSCAQFCAGVFGEGTSAHEQCAAAAAHHTGLCYTCGPASPGGTSPICCPQTSSGVYTSYSAATCCSSGQTCQNGTCTSCAAGELLCGGVCTGIRGDPNNCGSCGNVCPLPSGQCQVSACVNGQCTFANAANGTACNDGNACTQVDVCQDGTCVGSNPVVCSPSDQCHVAGICDPTTGACSNPTAADGTACQVAGLAGTCQSGACVRA
jgi:hypothetical protein